MVIASSNPPPIQSAWTTASRDLQPAHAKGLNVLYADTHVKYNRFTGRASPKSGGTEAKCLENWWVEHNWEGYYE